MLLDGARHHARCPRRCAPAPGSAAPSSSPTCFRNLTVLENVRLAVQAARRRALDMLRPWMRRARPDRARRRDPATRRARATGATVAAAALPHGDQRKLEVAMLMALEPTVFMFDEPTAGMSVDEVPVILDLIRELKAGREQDHPAGRAQDGRGALARRPHHRAAQRPAGRRRRAGRGDRLAGRAGGLSRHRCRERARHERAAHARTACTPTSAQYHILHGVDFEVPEGRTHDAARPQRRRQDDDAAHHHGPVARLRRRDHASTASDIDALGDARDRARRHRLRAREHGHLRRPDGEGEPGARRARRRRSTRRGSTGSSASSRR